MKVIKSPRIMQATAKKLIAKKKSIGFVPTMGALHDGHISLIKRARRENDVVVVSIFVNPSQFGPNEDYLKYPRPFLKDKKICRAINVDYIFYPETKAMYPEECRTKVKVSGISDILCGHFRPGHFLGVAVIVTKLFNIVKPHLAYFGSKDYQQLSVINRLVSDLNMDVKIVECPIIRDKRGLALSSRNQYLSIEGNKNALIISRSLRFVRELIVKRKVKRKQDALSILKKEIKKIPNSKIDYIEIRKIETLQELSELKHPFVILVAVWINKTRLIDNIVVKKI